MSNRERVTVSRDGAVRRGKVLIGYVRRDGRYWRNDACSDRFPRQCDAVLSLMRIIP